MFLFSIWRVPCVCIGPLGVDNAANYRCDVCSIGSANMIFTNKSSVIIDDLCRWLFPTVLPVIDKWPFGFLFVLVIFLNRVFLLCPMPWVQRMLFLVCTNLLRLMKSHLQFAVYVNQCIEYYYISSMRAAPNWAHSRRSCYTVILTCIHLSAVSFMEDMRKTPLALFAAIGTGRSIDLANKIICYVVLSCP